MDTRKKVLVVDAISEKMQKLSRKYIIPAADLFFDGGVDEHLATADVLITSTKGISPEMLSRAKNCIYIQKYGVGVNNIAVSEATKRGIPVGNTPGQNAASVAEHAVMLMLAVFRNLIVAHNSLVNEGLWLKTLLRDRCYELSNKKVGIIGFGNVGHKIAALLKGFECEIVYYDVTRLSVKNENELGIRYSDLDTLIKESEVITLHVPLTDQTRHLMNKERLYAMKPTSVLINTSRGGVIDESALVEVLQSGHLSGAGIDVFETEPLAKDHPLLKIRNIVLTPHNAGGTNEAMERIVQNACQNINAMLKYGKVAIEDTIVNYKDLN